MSQGKTSSFRVTRHVLAWSILFLPLTSIKGMTVTNSYEKAFGSRVIFVEFKSNEIRGFSIRDVPVWKKGDNVMNYWNGHDDEMIINGGFYQPDFLPLGLCRIDGVTIGSGRANRRSGFVAIDSNGSMRLLTRKDDRARYKTILQSGPYVIDPGGVIGIQEGSKTNDFPARRTLVGTKNDKSIIVMSTGPITLYNLARAVKIRFPEIDRLLDLDGGPSTALVTGVTAVTNGKPVRNYIVKKIGNKLK